MKSSQRTSFVVGFNGNLFRLLSIIFVSVFFVSCDLEEEEDDDSATMCYVKDGTYVTINCRPNSLGSCGSDGKSSLGSYDAWQSCYEDMDDVISNYEDSGNLRPGPNALGGNGGNNGGSTVSCDIVNYNGPEFDIQVDSQCKLAFLADCSGNTQQRDAACAIYYDYGSAVWAGNGSLPECPYCN